MRLSRPTYLRSLLTLGIGLAATSAPALGQSYTWKSLAMGGGGFVSAVIPSKQVRNLWFARTDVGGFYRWNQSASSWIPLTDWASEDETGYLGVEAVALDPQNAANVYALVGISYFNGGKTAILRSTDTGNTFQVTEVTSQFKAHGNGLGRANGERLAVDPNLSTTLFCGTRWNGLWKSTNSGATWTQVTSFPVNTTANENGVSFVLFDPTTGTKGNATQRIWAVVSRMGAANLYVSNDGGANWSAVPGAITTSMPQRAGLSSTGILYVTYGNGAGPHGHWSLPEPMEEGSLQKLVVSSGAWTNITPANFTRAMGGVSVDPSNPNHLLASSINTYFSQPWGWGDVLFRSIDGGANWTSEWTAGATMSNAGIPWIDNHAVHWAGTIEFDPFNPEQAMVTSGNGIFRTANLSAANSVWAFHVAGLEETVPLDALSVPGGPFVSVIGDYDGFVHTSPSAYSAGGAHKPGMGSTTGIAMAGQKAATLVRVGEQVQVSTNTGTTWAALTKPNTEVKGRVGISADGRVVLWSSEKATMLQRTGNQGSSWTTATGISTAVAPMGDQVDAARFYVYVPSSGQFLVSTDTGKSFAARTSPGSGGSWNIRPVPERAGDVWVALYDGGLTRTRDGGANWTKLSSVSQCGSVGFGKEKAGSTFPSLYIWGTVGGVRGLHRSDDSGTTWTRLNDDAHEFGGPGNGQFVLGDGNVWGRVYMSTAGRGIVWGEPQTSVGIPSHPTVRGSRLLRDGNLLHGLPGQPLELVDLGGRRILSATATEGASRLDLASLPSGLYVARSGATVEMVRVR